VQNGSVGRTAMRCGIATTSPSATCRHSTPATAAPSSRRAAPTYPPSIPAPSPGEPGAECPPHCPLFWGAATATDPRPGEPREGRRRGGGGGGAGPRPPPPPGPPRPTGPAQRGDEQGTAQPPRAGAHRRPAPVSPQARLDPPRLPEAGLRIVAWIVELDVVRHP